jgi:hypothetical protein
LEFRLAGVKQIWQAQARVMQPEALAGDIGDDAAGKGGEGDDRQDSRLAR